MLKILFILFFIVSCFPFLCLFHIRFPPIFASPIFSVFLFLSSFFLSPSFIYLHFQVLFHVIFFFLRFRFCCCGYYHFSSSRGFSTLSLCYFIQRLLSLPIFYPLSLSPLLFLSCGWYRPFSPFSLLFELFIQLLPIGLLFSPLLSLFCWLIPLLPLLVSLSSHFASDPRYFVDPLLSSSFLPSFPPRSTVPRVRSGSLPRRRVTSTRYSGCWRYTRRSPNTR